MFSKETTEFPWSDLIVKVPKSISRCQQSSHDCFLDVEVDGCLLMQYLPRGLVTHAQSWLHWLILSGRSPLTVDAHRDGTSYTKSVLWGESCPCLLQKPAGAWEDSATWPDVKVLHAHPLSQFIPSRQPQIIKPNEVFGLLGTSKLEGTGIMK